MIPFSYRPGDLGFVEGKFFYAETGKEVNDSLKISLLTTWRKSDALA